MTDIDLIRGCVRDVPDYPKPGIMFKDITPLLGNRDAFKATIAALEAHVADREFECIAGIESRGFIFGAALAIHMSKRFVPIRKPGKLPAATYEVEYELEYGSDALQVHQDALHDDERVLIVDDLLATGGTAAATSRLIHKSGGVAVAAAFVIELSSLSGRQTLGDLETIALLRY